jgi:hypothetical protein
MRKRIVGLRPTSIDEVVKSGWINLEDLLTVEVTSEAPDFPIESALVLGGRTGWRAADAGEQTIRLVFDHPTSLHHIQLRFDDPAAERTQEFTLRWSSAEGQTREIVHQQWNFSPAGSTFELEEYAVELNAVSVLELEINPDLGRTNAVASLTSLRLR